MGPGRRLAPWRAVTRRAPGSSTGIDVASFDRRVDHGVVDGKEGRLVERHVLRQENRHQALLRIDPHQRRRGAGPAELANRAGRCDGVAFGNLAF